LHGLADELDHLLFLGIHQSYPRGRGSGLRIVLCAPVGHFHQERNEIETFFRQDIPLFALLCLMGLFHENALVLKMRKAQG
jgi:hypothetical protein